MGGRYPRRQGPVLKWRYLLDIVLIGAVAYGIWMLASGRFTSGKGGTFAEQQRIVQLYNYRTQYNADVEALRLYRNESSNASGARRQEVTNQIIDMQGRCRDDVAGYDNLARTYTIEYLMSLNIPATLDYSQCS